MIPQEILEKYKYPQMEDYMQEDLVDQCRYYKGFLDKTDYEMTKAFETLFNDPENFQINIVNLLKEYQDVIQWRVFARDKVRELEDE